MKTLAEINAQNQQARVDAAVYLAPKIEQGDVLFGEAFSVNWLARYRAYLEELPEGEYRNHCVAIMQVINGLPAFLAAQRAQIAPFQLPGNQDG